MSGSESGEKRGNKVVLAAIVGGIVLAIGGSYIILSSSGLGPSAGKSGPSGEANFEPDAAGTLQLDGANRSCTTNADCTLVNPSPCSPCGCASVPVSASEDERVRKSSASLDCSQFPQPQVDCGSCAPVEVGCLDGVCSTVG